jgi:hypothetical protein
MEDNGSFLSNCWVWESVLLGMSKGMSCVASAIYVQNKTIRELAKKESMLVWKFWDFFIRQGKSVVVSWYSSHHHILVQATT